MNINTEKHSPRLKKSAEHANPSPSFLTALSRKRNQLLMMCGVLGITGCTVPTKTMPNDFRGNEVHDVLQEQTGGIALHISNKTGHNIVGSSITLTSEEDPSTKIQVSLDEQINRGTPIDLISPVGKITVIIAIPGFQEQKVVLAVNSGHYADIPSLELHSNGTLASSEVKDGTSAVHVGVELREKKK